MNKLSKMRGNSCFRTYSSRESKTVLQNAEKEEEEEVSAYYLANFEISIAGGKNIIENNINEWINCDVNDQGFEHLTDEQIVGQHQAR